MIKKEVVVEKSKKIVEFLQDFGFSFGDVSKMLRNKDVKVNGKATKENVLLQTSDVVIFFYKEEMLQKKFEIVFEDDNVLIVYKNAGIEVEGEKGLEGVLGAKPAHRLDRNTEGLVLFAKNENTLKLLEKAIKEKKVHKFYLAEVVGKFCSEGKVFEAYLVKDSENSFVQIFDKKQKGGVKIETYIKTLSSNDQSSVLLVELLTGKTHQIRAHLAHLGCPIIGDGKYGKNSDNKKFKQNRQKLAAFKLKIDYFGYKNLDFQEFVKFPKWINSKITEKL